MKPVEYYKEIKDRYDKIGSGFCVLKWHYLQIHHGSAQSHSCFHCPQRHLSLDEDLHNTKQKMKQRKTMLEGGRPEECSYCWNAEDVGAPSSRITMAPIYTEMQPDIIETTAKLKWDESVYPKYLEMSFSNVCQLKCSYCSTQNSSAWHDEIKKHGDYPLIDVENKNQYVSHGRENLYEEDSPMHQKFWEWFDEAKKHLKVMRITGGEPLLHESTFRLAEIIKDTGIDFHVNSNLCVSKRRIKRLVTLNPDVKIYASVDSIGTQAEWIRHGLDWEMFEDNISKLVHSNIEVGLMVTFNLLSIPKFHEFLQWVLRYKQFASDKFKLDTPFMTNPKHLSALILDDNMMDTLYSARHFMQKNTDDNNPHKFNSGEFAKFDRVVKLVESNRFDGEDLNRHRKDFRLFVDEHDKRRGVNWHECFPELKSFYESCDAAE